MKKRLFNYFPKQKLHKLPINYLLAFEITNSNDNLITHIKKSNEYIKIISTRTKNFHGFNKPIIKFKIYE